MRVIIFLILCLYISPSVLSLNELVKFENHLSKNVQTYFNSTEIKFDITALYLDLICSRNISARNVSVRCAGQMDIVCNNSSMLSQMSDAWSKFPYSGMQVSTHQDWGTFDQCVAVDYQPKDGPRVLGKHCVNGLAIPLAADDIYLLSYCVPDACSALDLARMISTDLLPETVLENLVNEAICSTKETNKYLDAPAITVASLFVFFLGLMILSTTYDVFLHTYHIENTKPLLTAFSVFSNGRKLIQSTKDGGVNNEQILVFHGIKVISMMWVVAGHNAGAYSVLRVANAEEMAEWQHKRYSQYITSAYVAVDTFFYISGFLMAYQYFNVLAKKPIRVQVMSIPKMIIHRYLRVTPAVLMAFLYSVYLANHVGNGPMFTRIHKTVSDPCKRNWWAVFLYIQNYYNPKHLCMDHLWYLSADFQLFIISPLLLIPIAWQFRRRFNWVLVQLLIINVLVMLLPVWTKLSFRQFDPDLEEYDAHSKLTIYFMGITFGFYLRCQRHKPYVFRGISNIIMWSLTIVTMLGISFALDEVNFNNNHGYVTKALSTTFLKPLWCLALTFVIYSCTYKRGGIVNWMLSAEGMQIISKLTYCMYIMHVPVIYYWLTTRRTGEYFSDFNVFFTWCGQFILTLVVAVIWTLAFESPLITIERFLLGGGGPRKPNIKNESRPKEPIEVVKKTPHENDIV